jgi:phosphatidylserine/phosphatidylglycerophosphate/cardiolipin synthase-like enzyme
VPIIDSAYEFHEKHVLLELKAAWKDRGVDVQILYHGKEDSTKATSDAAIEEFKLGKICNARVAKGLTLSHNKTIVLLKNGKAQAVLTGSTNFSDGGIYGHSNVVHVCEDKSIAAKYLWLWDTLSKNNDKKADAPVIASKTPLPADSSPGVTPIFSPRDDLSALDWYAEQAKGAKEALFMTFAFGMNDRFQDAYANGESSLRYALMEKMSGPAKTPEIQKENDQKIIALRKMSANKFAIGGQLKLGAFDRWTEETLTGLNKNVKYLHTKYMLVDPLGTNPMVVTGSANFSDASTTNNDENMLAIVGDTRVADIYLGEFMRLYRHYAFRDWLSKKDLSKEESVAVTHLDENDTWWKSYFGDSFASRQREYFAGK